MERNLNEILPMCGGVYISWLVILEYVHSHAYVCTCASAFRIRVCVMQSFCGVFEADYYLFCG